MQPAAKNAERAARIKLGSVYHDCLVSELSDTGARLRKTVVVPWPPTVVLCVGERVKVTRECRVVFENADDVAVEFTA
jgi:hypothetical protein